MKYCAGDKYIRNTQWIKIRISSRLHIPKLRANVHKWCQAQHNEHHFYWHYSSDHWWFENEQDAIMFKLRWGKYVS